MKFYILFFFFFTIFFSQNLILGLSPKYSKEKQVERFTLLKSFLQDRLDMIIEIKYANTATEFINEYISGEYDIAFSSSILFVQVRIKNSKVFPLASVKNKGKTFYKYQILVKKESGFNSISDLNGLKFGFGEKESTSRYLIPNYFLSSKNILRGDTFFDRKVDVSIERLQSGEVDAITVYKFGTIPSDLTALHESFKIPEYLFSVNTEKVDKNLKERLYKTILAAPIMMSKKLRASYTGFSETRMKNFNHLIDIAHFYLKED